MTDASYTVFYLNPGATPEICAVIREQLPGGWRLLTPRQTTDFASELSACDFLIVADHPVTAHHLALARRLRMIQHQGVGYERIDLDACRARGIPVGLTPEGTSVGVAEHTLLLILALYKQLVKAAVAVPQGRWMQWELRQQSFELSGKTLGLLGFGRIGREVARRAVAFDARVLYYDPWSDSDAAEGRTVERCADRATLLQSSDIVSLHLPLNRDTHHIVNATTLAQMRQTAVLVNTARGGLVQERALVDSLESGRLRGAALDVLEQEPPDADNPLLHLENVLVTPHIAAGTIDALRVKMGAVFANLLRCARGEPLANVVPDLADLARQ